MIKNKPHLLLRSRLSGLLSRPLKTNSALWHLHLLFVLWHLSSEDIFVVLYYVQTSPPPLNIWYSGNLSREKPSWLYSNPREFSLQNCRHATHVYAISLTFCESFLRKLLPSYQLILLYSTCKLVKARVNNKEVKMLCIGIFRKSHTRN